MFLFVDIYVFILVVQDQGWLGSQESQVPGLVFLAGLLCLMSGCCNDEGPGT